MADAEPQQPQPHLKYEFRTTEHGRAMMSTAEGMDHDIVSGLPWIATPPDIVVDQNANAVFWTNHFNNYCENASEESIGMVQFYEFGRPIVGVLGESLQKEAIQLEMRGLARSILPPAASMLTGPKSLLLLSGPEHAAMRKTFGSLLSWESLEVRYGLMQFETEKYLNNLCEECLKRPGEYIRTFPYNKTLAYNIATSFIFGTGDEMLLDEDEVEYCMKWCNVWIDAFADQDPRNSHRPGTVLNSGVVAKEKLDVFFTNVINKMKVRDHATMSQKALLYKLVFGVDGAVVDMQTILDSLVFIVFAAHDGTAGSLNNIMYHLHANPAERAFLREQILPEIIDEETNRVPFSELVNDAYLDGFTRECLRFDPPASTLRRQLSQDYTFNNGVTVPKGVYVHIPIVGVSDNDDIFPEARQFSPRRYMDNGANEFSSKYNSMPFGMGKRRCPGMNLATTEMKYLATVLSNNVEFEVDPERVKYGLDFTRYRDIYVKFRRVSD